MKKDSLNTGWSTVYLSSGVALVTACSGRVVLMRMAMKKMKNEKKNKNTDIEGKIQKQSVARNINIFKVCFFCLK